MCTHRRATHNACSSLKRDGKSKGIYRPMNLRKGNNFNEFRAPIPSRAFAASCKPRPGHPMDSPETAKNRPVIRWTAPKRRKIARPSDGQPQNGEKPPGHPMDSPKTAKNRPVIR